MNNYVTPSALNELHPLFRDFITGIYSTAYVNFVSSEAFGEFLEAYNIRTRNKLTYDLGKRIALFDKIKRVAPKEKPVRTLLDYFYKAITEDEIINKAQWGTIKQEVRFCKDRKLRQIIYDLCTANHNNLIGFYRQTLDFVFNSQTREIKITAYYKGVSRFDKIRKCLEPYGILNFFTPIEVIPFDLQPSYTIRLTKNVNDFWFEISGIVSPETNNIMVEVYFYENEEERPLLDEFNIQIF